MPRRIQNSPNEAVRAAITMSQASAMSQPPPTATPFTRAITGLSSSRMRRIASCAMRASATMPAESSVESTGRSRCLSPPAQNARSPAPVTTTTRTESSSRAQMSACSKSR